MQCKQCGEVVEAEARFCGNCGTQLQVVPVLTLALNQGLPVGAPAYARATPAYHAGEIHAWLSVLCGVLGIVGGIFVALAGLAFGVAGLVLATTARTSPRRTLSMIGMGISCISILTGLIVWVYAVTHDVITQPDTKSLSTSKTANAATPCYSLGFSDALTMKTNEMSCNIQAYNGANMSDSTGVYKIFAEDLNIPDETTFYDLAKRNINEDISKNLAGFEVSAEGKTSFAGSPAYYVKATDAKSGASIIEAAVWHEVSNGEDVFVLVHATSEQNANLADVEAEWQWR